MFIVSVNLADADFYIQRNGTPETVGKPTLTPSPDHFGVLVDRSRLLPDFFYLFAAHCHQAGLYKPYAHGALALQHLRVDQVRQVLREEMRACWGAKKNTENTQNNGVFASVNRSE